MTFTKAQKEALWRKIDEVASKKKNKLVEEFTKNWKPSPKCKDILDKIKKASEYAKKADELWREVMQGSNYSCNLDFDGVKVYVYSSNNYDGIMSQYKSAAIEKYQSELYEKKVIPSETAVMDELELQLLSKTFDVQAFLAKFGVKE